MNLGVRIQNATSALGVAKLVNKHYVCRCDAGLCREEEEETVTPHKKDGDTLLGNNIRRLCLPDKKSEVESCWKNKHFRMLMGEIKETGEIFRIREMFQITGLKENSDSSIN